MLYTNKSTVDLSMSKSTSWFFEVLRMIKTMHCQPGTSSHHSSMNHTITPDHMYEKWFLPTDLNISDNVYLHLIQSAPLSVASEYTSYSRMCPDAHHIPQASHSRPCKCSCKHLTPSLAGSFSPNATAARSHRLICRCSPLPRSVAFESSTLSFSGRSLPTELLSLVIPRDMRLHRVTRRSHSRVLSSWWERP